MWVRGFRDPTIPGRGFNLFKPLRRHFRAGAGPERRVWRTRIRRGGIPSAFSEFSMLCEAENFPPRSSARNSPIADEARRRRFASHGSWAVGRDLRERSAMAVSWCGEGHSNNIPRFCFSERKNSKISKAAICPKDWELRALLDDTGEGCRELRLPAVRDGGSGSGSEGAGAESCYGGRPSLNRSLA